MSRLILPSDNRATIYHGTPLTPRAALTAVGTGRAMCVSFFRPDDVEVVEAISPTIMFRQRRVLRMDSCAQTGRGILRPGRLDPVLSLVGATPFPTWPMGSDTRCTRCSFAGQRRVVKRMAVRCRARCASLAYGRSDQSAGTPLRSLPSSCVGLDRTSQTRAGRLRSISAADGRSCPATGQLLAANSHDARDRRCLRLSVSKRRQHLAGTERTPLRLAGSPRRHLFRTQGMVRPANLRRST